MNTARENAMKAYRPLKYMEVEDLKDHLLFIGDDAVASAIDLAVFAHSGQFRKEFRMGKKIKDDYVIHPMRNACRVARWGGDNHQIVIGLLHDTLEDAPEKVSAFTGFSDPAEGLERMFDERISTAVVGMSNVPGVPYADHVVEACAANVDVLVNKASDLKDNAGSLGYMPESPRRDRLVKKYVPVVSHLKGVTECDPGLNMVHSAMSEVDSLLSML